MYPASADFHNAVKNGNPQMPLLIFPTAVFTAEDIDINAGIEFDDLFNTEENTSIGQALMNNIRFTLFNDNQLLNDYEFGEFVATIGVRIARNTYTQEGNISITCGSNEYIAYQSAPYVTRNGVELDSAMTGSMANIISYNGIVYCFQKNGNLYCYDESTGERVHIISDVNLFDNSVAGWVTGKYINADGGISSTSSYRYTDHYYPIKANSKFIAHYNKRQSRAHTIAFYKKDQTFIKRTVLSSSSDANGIKDIVFTTPEETAYYRFSCGTTTADIFIAENVPMYMRTKFKAVTYYGAYFANNILNS